MRIVRYTQEFEQNWNDFIRAADNGHFMFIRKYMEYHADRFNDHSLLVYDENKLRGVLPANSEAKMLYSHQGLTFGGLVLNSKSYTADVLQMIEAIIAYGKEQGFDSWLYKVIPTVFHNVSRQEDVYALWRKEAKLLRRDVSSIVDLRKEVRYRSTKKQNIKKGRQAELDIKETQDLTALWSLLHSVLDTRHDARPTHSLEEISLLQASFAKNIRCFEVYGSDTLLGGALLFINNHSVHTQYLAVGEDGRSIGALDYLLDHLIQWSKAEGYHYFSFGISTEEQGRKLNEGLIFQKEGFGARAVMHDFYRIDF